MHLFVDKERFRTDKKPWFGELPVLSKRDFSFAVVGDRTGFALEGVFEGALEVLKKLNPDFVLSVGDLAEGYWLAEEEAHKEWDDIDLHIRQLGIPFFRAIGNHDCGSELMLDVWRDRYGGDYYAFRHDNTLFLILNTEDPPIPIPEKYIPVLRELEALAKSDPVKAEEEIQTFIARIPETKEGEQTSSSLSSCIGEAQLEFIERTLAENQDADWTFVVMHRPLWKTEDPAFTRLESILKDRKHTVFAGHLHNLEVTETEGNFHIQMGRAGACKHRKGLNDFHHILWVSVTNGKPPNFIVMKLDGLSAIESFRKI